MFSALRTRQSHKVKANVFSCWEDALAAFFLNLYRESVQDKKLPDSRKRYCDGYSVA